MKYTVHVPVPEKPRPELRGLGMFGLIRAISGNANAPLPKLPEG